GTPTTLFPKSWPKSVWNEIRRPLRSRREERPSKQRMQTAVPSECSVYDKMVDSECPCRFVRADRAIRSGATAETFRLSGGTQAKILPRFPGHPRRTSASATHRRCFKESRFRSRNREGIKRRGRRDTSEQ